MPYGKLTSGLAVAKILVDMRLFGTSGIRRVADASLIEMAMRVGLALGQAYSSVVVAGDSRTSTEAVKHALVSGLLMAGAGVRDAGVVPTPTLALATREFAAGAMITASHNPPEYNGIKLLNSDGSAFDSEQQRQIEAMVADSSLALTRWDKITGSSPYHGAVARHTKRILRDFPAGLGLRVVLDCGCGAAAVITPHLLRRLGCEVVELNCYPSGFFPRAIEPTDSNLGDLIRATGEAGANLGIAHDGDADRMMAVDDKGRFIPGDKLLALLARDLGAEVVVTTVDASMAIDEMGFSVTRTKVGDNHVSERLKHLGDFGGEPSGSWVFPAISLCPDGIYAAARLATLAARQKLSSLVDAIPSYPLLRGSINSEGAVMPELEQKLVAMKPLSVSSTDGIRLKFADGWLLVRASGTEPKVRVTAEAKDEGRMRQLYDAGIGAVRECIGGGKEE